MSMTIKDIAKIANVSTATVSRVLNNNYKGNMRKETYERVEKIIIETSYIPHAVAAGLRKGLLKTVGVILPDSTNPYYAQLGRAIENEAFKNGYLTLVCNTDLDVNKEIFYIRLLLGHRVSGIILCSTGLNARQIKSILPKEIYVVLLDEEIKDFDADLVIVNDFLGGYMGAQYLYNLGHRNVAVITGPKNLSSSQQRLTGYLKFMKEKGINIDYNNIIASNYTLESSYRIVKKLFYSKSSISAIFTFNDLMAIGAIKALYEMNIRVPDEISVLGFDNIFLDNLVTPNITTIETPINRLAKLAVKKLVNQQCKEEKTKKIIVDPKLIERQSCKNILT